MKHELRRRTKGIADPLTLALLALLGVSVVSQWHPLDIFKPKPPTAELTKLQADLAAANAAAEQARKDRDAAAINERAKLEAEVRAAQQDNLGTQTALGRVPAEHRTAEVKLAVNMATRVSLKLAASIGKLPADQQEAMIQLIDQALSDKQTEVDEAVRKLAARDADFRALSAERDAIKAQIPVLERKAAETAAVVVSTQEQVTIKTNEVKVIADKLDAEKRTSGSLAGIADRWFHIALWIVGVWAFLAYVLPGLLKHLNEGNWFKTALRNVSGYVTSPLLFHDARKKLSEAAKLMGKTT